MIGSKKLGVVGQNTAYRFGCKALAVVLAVALTAPMTGAPWATQALADESDTDIAAPATQEDNHGITVRGVDFMQPSAQGAWDVLRVDGAQGGESLYFDIKKDDTPIASRQNFKYTLPGVSDAVVGEQVAGNDQSKKIAQIIELDMNQTTADGTNTVTLGTAFSDRYNFPVYTLEVYDAKIGGQLKYEGQIYPVYAKLNVETAAEEGVEPAPVYKFLGIRTAGPNDTFGNTIGAGTSYYLDNVHYAAEFINAAEEPVVVNEGNCFVISYAAVSDDAISGSLKYVDVDGNVVRTVPVPDLGNGKLIPIEPSFFATVPVRNEDGTVQTDEEGNIVEEVAYFRVIDRLSGNSVPLDASRATAQVRVMRVAQAEAGAYQVTIKYVEETSGDLLWEDAVDVKGNGYQYTLPNIFSMSSVVVEENEDGTTTAMTDRSKEGWGIRQYTLSGVEVNLDKALATKAAETPENNGENTETATVDPVVVFPPASEGNLTVIATYTSQKENDKVNLFIQEWNGENGQLLDTVKLTVDPENSATYTPEERMIDGKKFVPWSGNVNSITYEWADLEKGTDLTQNVYYVSEDYVPGDAYDVTVQYMNVANNQIIRSEAISIDPDITDFVDIESPATFTEGGNTYVRLAGQEAAPRHAYLSPTRVYTIYYRDVNDELSANITVRRTQINETERVELVPGPVIETTNTVVTTVTEPATQVTPLAAPVVTDDGTVDLGVGVGDGTTVINDDNNPLANLDGQDTTTERTIADDENPLASGVIGSEQSLDANDNQALIAAGIGIGALAIIGLLFFLLMRKRKKEQSEMAPVAVTDYTDEA